jgi:hypothetical protein
VNLQTPASPFLCSKRSSQWRTSNPPHIVFLGFDPREPGGGGAASSLARFEERRGVSRVCCNSTSITSNSFELCKLVFALPAAVTKSCSLVCQSTRMPGIATQLSSWCQVDWNPAGLTGSHVRNKSKSTDVLPMLNLTDVVCVFLSVRVERASASLLVVFDRSAHSELTAIFFSGFDGDWLGQYCQRPYKASRFGCSGRLINTIKQLTNGTQARVSKTRVPNSSVDFPDSPTPCKLVS